MRKNILLPAVALVGGGVGFALRKWQLATGFEADTGLSIPGTPAALALIGWSVLVAVVLLALCWQNKERMCWDRAFAAARENPLFLTACVAAAFLMLLSAGMEIITYSAGGTMTVVDTMGARAAVAALPPLRIALCAGAFLCVLLWARTLNRGSEKGKENLALLELCLTFCVWLLSDYQIRAADPVTLNYVYEVLAIVAALMGLYYIAGYSFQTGKPRRTVTCCLLGAYFSLVTLADSHTLAEIFRYGFIILFLTAHSALILGEHPAGEEPAETEDNKNAE